MSLLQPAKLKTRITDFLVEESNYRKMTVKEYLNAFTNELTTQLCVPIFPDVVELFIIKKWEKNVLDRCDREMSKVLSGNEITKLNEDIEDSVTHEFWQSVAMGLTDWEQKMDFRQISLKQMKYRKYSEILQKRVFCSQDAETELLNDLSLLREVALAAGQTVGI